MDDLTKWFSERPQWLQIAATYPIKTMTDSRVSNSVFAVSVRTVERSSPLLAGRGQLSESI